MKFSNVSSLTGQYQTRIYQRISFRVIGLLDQTCVASDSKVHGANMGPTWVLSAPNGPHVGPMNLAIKVHNEMYKLLREIDGLMNIVN